MKTMRLICCVIVSAVLLPSCSKREAKSVEAAVDEPVATALMEEEKPQIDDSVRLVKRANAIADLLSAHQKVSMDELYAEKFGVLIAGAQDAAEIAGLQNDLSEIRNDIRDTKAAIPELEKKALELSQRGDPSYELELATYKADIAEAVETVAKAKRAGATNAKQLEETLVNMHKATVQAVMAGIYPMPKD